MKIECETNVFRLIPESHGDKMYIAYFYKELCENSLTKNVDALFSFSEDRMDINRPRGGGSLAPEKIVEQLYEAEDFKLDPSKYLVAIEEITALEIYNYPQ